MKQIVNKLRSRAGETIGEVLVALLVSTLALMILAGMISATSGIVKTSETKINDYYEANAGLETFDGAQGSAKLTLTVGSHTVDVSVIYKQNSTFGTERTVTAYRYANPAAGVSGD